MSGLFSRAKKKIPANTGAYNVPENKQPEIRFTKSRNPKSNFPESDINKVGDCMDTRRGK